MPPKTKADSQQFLTGDQDWSICPICTGFFVKERFGGRAYSLTVGNARVAICAWCYSRGGKFLSLFVMFVEAYANRPCETDDMDRVSDPCKCGPCTARRLLEYREKIVGAQVAPIKTTK